jgi:hypothetical protein
LYSSDCNKPPHVHVERTKNQAPDNRMQRTSPSSLRSRWLAADAERQAAPERTRRIAHERAQL